MFHPLPSHSFRFCIIAALLFGGSSLFTQPPCLDQLDDLLAAEAFEDIANCYYDAATTEIINQEKGLSYWLQAGNYYRKAKKNGAAKAAYLEIIKTSSPENRAVDSLKALAHHSTGLVLYREEAFPAAIATTRQAITIRDKLYPKGHNDLGKSYFNLGLYFYKASEMDSAVIAFQESNYTYSRAPKRDTSRWIRSLNHLALAYSQLNDHQMVQSSTQRSVSLGEQFYQDDPYALGDMYYYAAQGLQIVGLPDEMIAYANLSRSHFALDGGPELEALALNAAAAAYIVKKEYRKAIQIYQEALGLLTQLPYDSEYTADVYYGLSLCHSKLRNWSVSLRNGKAAIKRYEEQSDSLTIARSYQIAAYSATQMGIIGDAEENFDKSILYLFGGDKIPAAANVPEQLLVPLADILDDRAQYYEFADRFSDALADYERVFALQDRIRTDLTSQESQQYISQRIRPFFQRAIHLQYQLFLRDQEEDHLWDALILAERSKAFSLLLDLSNGREDQPRRERELRRRIATLERSERENELAAARLELERLLNFKRGTQKDLQNLDPEKLKAYLREKNIHLFEYALGEDNSYVFSVSPAGKISMSQLQLGSNFPAEVADFRKIIEQSAYKEVSLNKDQGVLDRDFTGASYVMFSKLFPQYPDASDLHPDLLIVPDAYLSFVPFGALLTDPAVESPVNYQQLPYLQEGRRMSFSYSALYLLQLNQLGYFEVQKNMLAMAPSFPGTAAVNSTRSGEVVVSHGQNALPGLLPLRYNEEEVQGIAELIPGTDAFFTHEAKRAVFERVGGDYRILHLSSHALVNADDPNASFIAFSQAGDSLETNEILYLNDLSTLDLSAELAVLSACETSMGRYAPGEGVLSLARAFAQAGAAATLTTLWKVDDEATKEMMIIFYEAIKAEKSRTASLQATYHHAISSPTFAHPYYWSALTLYGRADPIELKTGWFTRSRIIGLLAIGLSLLSILLWRRRK